MHNVDVVNAMRSVKQKWYATDPNTVLNCWNHCFHRVTNSRQGIIVKDIEPLRELLSPDLRENNILYSTIGAEVLIKLTKEDAVMEEVSLNSLVTSIAGSNGTVESEVSTESNANSGI